MAGKAKVASKALANTDFNNEESFMKTPIENIEQMKWCRGTHRFNNRLTDRRSLGMAYVKLMTRSRQTTTQIVH
jgi:hypothetical protein